MLPKFVDAPDTPTLNVIMFDVYTGYPLVLMTWYLLHERQRQQPKRKVNTGIPKLVS